MHYHLDDDNIIHPNLYKALDNINNDKTYTFDQYNRLKGNNISVGYIDTAIVIIPFNLCKNIEWRFDIYEAGGQYIKECINNNIDNYV
jgi:hypothetical protein